MKLLRSRKPEHSLCLFGRSLADFVNDSLDIRQKLGNVLDFVKYNWGGIIGKEQSWVFASLLLNVKWVERDVFTRRLCNFPQESAFTNLSCPDYQHDGEKRINTLESLLDIAFNEHKTSYNPKSNFRLSEILSLSQAKFLQFKIEF